MRNYTEEVLASVKDNLHGLNQAGFEPSSFKYLGLAIYRGLFPTEQVQIARESWLKKSGSSGEGRKLRFNPVENLDLPDELLQMSRATQLVSNLTKVFGPLVGVFKRRVVAKDASFSGSIFLHQDSGYQRGTLDKASLFIALTDIYDNSGGLEFWLGTHRFGYLDDAGEINPSALPNDWIKVKPELQVGDAVLMDSRLWHGSSENKSGQPRIMTDFIYQSAECPSSMEIIHENGDFESTISPVLFSSPTLFARSRVSKITELSEKLKDLGQ